MINNYWHNLNERERWITGAGAFLTLSYLLYLLIYAPLTLAVAHKSQQLVEKQETLTWMQQIHQQSISKKPVQKITNTKLLALLGNQLTTNKLSKFAYQLQQTGSGDIQLTYDKVPFNSFLRWLWSLGNKYAITIKQLSVERTSTHGVVKLMIVFAAK